MIRARLLAAVVFGIAAFVAGMAVHALGWMGPAEIHPLWPATVAALVAFGLAPRLRRRAQVPGRSHWFGAGDGLLVAVLAYGVGVVVVSSLALGIRWDVAAGVLVDGFTTVALSVLPPSLALGAAAGVVFQGLVRRDAA
ncbi:MAG: hypothetical protein AAGI52_03780 [Bacteroidota bacterium]